MRTDRRTSLESVFNYSLANLCIQLSENFIHFVSIDRTRSLVSILISVLRCCRNVPRKGADDFTNVNFEILRPSGLKIRPPLARRGGGID
jgi:hypothetical protein